MLDQLDQIIRLRRAKPEGWSDKRQTSIANDERLIEKRILPAIGPLAVTALDRADVAKLHQSLRKTPYEANRTLALLSKMLNLAELPVRLV